MDEKERRKRKQMLAKKRKKQVMRQRLMLAAAAIVIILIIVIFASVRSCQNKAAETAAREKAEQEKKQAAEEKENNTLRLMAVGDNLYHDTVLAQGKLENGGWNYDFLYENVKKEIEKADIAIVNQEVPLVDDDEDTSGYPTFGTPLEAGDALVNAGFDVVTMATNHSYDKGSKGISESLSFWRDSHPDIPVLGIHDSQEDQDKNRVQIIKEKNFKIAMINYTTLINIGAMVPENESYAVDVYDEETVKADVAKAKEEADVVIVFLHTGVEYKNDVDNATQQRIDFLAEQGVDITICAHPHVIRPYGTVARPDGKNMLVYYSLGNFVSGQEGVSQLLEGMADITLQKDKDTGEVSVTACSMVPLVMHYEDEWKNCGVYRLEDYTEELAAKHGVHGFSQEEFTMDSINQYFEPFLQIQQQETENME